MVPQSGSGVRLTLARPRLPPACSGQASLTRVGHRRAALGSLGYKVTYPIPIIYVPLLMITHFVAFYLLVRPSGRQAAE